jgi:glycosyltransferase involved in cell wall biosynthesis
VVTQEARATVFAVPGDLATPTGGYAYDRRIIGELNALGWRTDVVDLGEEFPSPSARARAAACARLAALSVAAPVVIDGLALGVLPEAAQLLGTSRPLVALVHHPLALEAGVSAEDSVRLRASERTALAGARHVIVTSAPTARLVVADYGVSAERVSVVEPGTDRGSQVRRASGGAVALLAVGSVVPRKGYDVLIAALAELAALDWRLTIAGDCARSPATYRQLADAVARHGLGDRIAFRGSVDTDAVRVLYATSDLFVLPSRFEGYGMAYAEAIAHGLPVVGTTAGAIPATVPADAGVLVAPDDVAALAATLRRLIEEPRERERLAAGARAARFPSWREQGARFAAVLERLLERVP